MPEIATKKDDQGNIVVVTMGKDIATGYDCCCTCDNWDGDNENAPEQNCTFCDGQFDSSEAGPFTDPNGNPSDVIFVVSGYSVDDDVAINGDILDNGGFVFTDTGADPCPGSGSENGIHSGAQNGYCFYISASEIVQISWLNHFRGQCNGNLNWETWSPGCYGDPDFPYDGYGC